MDTQVTKPLRTGITIILKNELVKSDYMLLPGAPKPGLRHLSTLGKSVVPHGGGAEYNNIQYDVPEALIVFLLTRMCGPVNALSCIRSKHLTQPYTLEGSNKPTFSRQGFITKIKQYPHINRSSLLLLLKSFFGVCHYTQTWNRIHWMHLCL